jgi:hypothetical protein
MFEQGEAKSCPVCGMELAKFEDLPPSIEADEDGVPTAPENEVMPWTYFRRGRGSLAILGLVGMVLFFMPWVVRTFPDARTFSAFDLAHERIGWMWGPFAAWSVLIPTVLSRRTIAKMRGARVAAAFLSAVPIVAVANLLLHPPKGTIVGGFVIASKIAWQWPIYGTLAASILAVLLSVRFGGRVDDIKVSRGTSKGQHLH